MNNQLGNHFSPIHATRVNQETVSSCSAPLLTPLYFYPNRNECPPFLYGWDAWAFLEPWDVSPLVKVRRLNIQRECPFTVNIIHIVTMTRDAPAPHIFAACRAISYLPYMRPTSWAPFRKS